MAKKIYKNITQDNGVVTIYGSNRDIKTYYKQPSWSEEEEMAFKYRGNEYFISEFMRIDKHAPSWMQEFHGYMNDTYFSGVVIKIDDSDTDYIKVYSYCS